MWERIMPLNLMSIWQYISCLEEKDDDDNYVMTIEDEVKMKNPQLCALVLMECIASPTRYVFNWGQGPKDIWTMSFNVFVKLFLYMLSMASMSLLNIRLLDPQQIGQRKGKFFVANEKTMQESMVFQDVQCDYLVYFDWKFDQFDYKPLVFKVTFF